MAPLNLDLKAAFTEASDIGGPLAEVMVRLGFTRHVVHPAPPN